MTKKGGNGPIHIIMVDVITGEEKDLTALSNPGDNNDIDGLLEWSSDGKLLIFWHLNRTTNTPKIKSLRKKLLIDSIAHRFFRN